MAVTLKDVAEYAEVSMSTVSRVLNQKGNISEKTTQRVEKAISALMYKPSAAVSTLTDVQYHIGIVAPGNPSFFTDGYQVGIDVNALVSVIEDNGFIPYVTTVKYNSEFTPKIQELIEKSKIDGIIFCDYCESDQTKQLCRRKKLPFIATNGFNPRNHDSYVDFDNRDGAYQAMSYLYSLGHRTIGVITGPVNQEVTKNRLDGVTKAIKKFNLHVDKVPIVNSSYTMDGGEAAVHALLLRGELPTAIFAFSDKIAIGAITALKKIGLLVPEDISIVGFDNTEICSVISPPLTSIKRYSEQITPVIVRSIVDLIEAPNMKEIKILYGTDLVIRESCAPV